MNPVTRKILENTGLTTVLALTALMLLTASIAGAQVQYLADGAIPNAAGGWDLPAQGTCPADTNQTTRPECLALRIVAADSGACSTALGSWTTGGVCNDTLAASQAACEAKPDRLWNGGTAVCAIAMKDDDRNDVVCMLHNGTWVTTGTCTGSWVMPNGDAYTPNILTSAPTSPAGAGDQCLRCHNSRTQYNGPRVRDTEDTIYMGHKNMARKVAVTMPWGGPPFACTGFPLETTAEGCFIAGGFWDPTIYPGTDGGQNFDWVNGTVDIGTVGSPNPRDLYWIYADWLSAYPRAIYHEVPDTSTTPDKPKVSYSCARCHTTGWTADATLQTAKEPHKSFTGPAGSNQGAGGSGIESIVWDGVSDAIAGQVNLAPGTPYTEKMASWDVFGISCTRCHNSAIDLTIKKCYGIASSGACTLGTWDSRSSSCYSTEANCTTMGGSSWDLPHGAPTGMSTHHNDLTGPDVGSSGTGGYCTDPRFSAQAQCDNVGAAWLNSCSIAGVCSNPLFTTSGTCFLGGGTWTNYNSTGACATAGGTWSVPAVKCSILGVCNDPAMTTSATCTGTVASGDLTGLVRQWKAATDIIRCEDAGGHYTGSKTNRGQIITNLCMNCHRQESSGAPMDATNPATAIKVGPYHGSVGFVSHPHSNQFLNSPHGKFTGTFAQIPTGTFNWAGTGEYKSIFMTEGEAANTGNGCTGCHDVHNSVVAGDKPFAEECTECHAKDLSSMIHSGGPGTPLEEMATDPMEACVSCHMPHGEHLFRINTDATYSTNPPAALTGNTNANVAPDGSYPNAVWVDLDSACGKCHGGGIANVETSGRMDLKFWDEDPIGSNTSCAEAGGTWASGKCTVAAANSSACAALFGTWTSSSSLCTLTAAKYVRVPDPAAALMTAGERIRVAGAGAVYYDDDGVTKLNEDFDSYIVSTARAPWITLAGAATKGVIGAAVAQNPVKNKAAYFTKANLALKAKGIHNDKPYVNFGYTIGSPNTLQINVDASASKCSDSLANCDAFVWQWGDSTTTTTATPTASHIYATGGTKTITLTVEEYGVNEGSVTKRVRVFALDAPPLAGGTACESIVDANTWLASLTDGSTDTNGVRQVTVNWGDGTALSSAIDTTAPYSLIGTVFPHTYLIPGTFTIKQTAYDTIGQTNVRSCPVTLSYFTISGGVFRSDGTTPVASATVTIRKGLTLAKTVVTNSSGLYTAGFLKPGTYTVTVTKTGYNFGAAPQRTGIVIGPNATVTNINAVTP